MLVICPIFDRCDLLPFYIRHYRDLGCTRIVVALWNGKENPLYHVIDHYRGSLPMEIRTSVECERKDYSGPLETNGLNAIREEFTVGCTWYCLADLDEFCYFNGLTVQETVKAAEALGHTAVHGVIHDRIAPNYKFPPIRLLRSLDATFPLVCDFTRCLGANFNKIPLAHRDVLIERGHHTTSGNPWVNQAEIHHFKWSDGLLERLRERHLFFTAQGQLWAGEYAVFLRALTETNYMEDSNYDIRPARKLGI